MAALTINQAADLYLLAPGATGTNGNRLAAYFISGGYSGDFLYRQVTDSAQLYKVSEQIRVTSYLYSMFAAVNAFVVTWYLDPASSDANLKNSFQLVLVTDGTWSFLVFNYARLDQRTSTGSFYTAVNGTIYSFAPTTSASNGVQPGQSIYAY